MTVLTENLINDLIEQTQLNINEAIAMQSLSTQKLNWKSSEISWSILECIAHLNKYGDFYLSEIKNRIKMSHSKPSTQFKSGILGEYFAKSMAPKVKLNTMKTFRNMNPVNGELGPDCLAKFIDQQKEMLDLLDASRMINLRKVKTSISISKLIKLRLGDTFRVVIYHNDRHIAQAKKMVLD